MLLALAVAPAADPGADAGRLGRRAARGSGRHRRRHDPARRRRPSTPPATSCSDVRIRWFQSGGHFEGTVDSTGLATAGAVGALQVTALASAAGRREGQDRPSRSSPSCPGPAADVALEPGAQPAVRRADGGRHRPSSPPPPATSATIPSPGAPTSPASSGASSNGLLTAVRPGRATGHGARAGRRAPRCRSRCWPIRWPRWRWCPPRPRRAPATWSASPSTRGTAPAPAVPDVLPEWMVSPGSARIEPDGGFVASEAGTYRVVGAFAGPLGHRHRHRVAARRRAPHHARRARCRSRVSPRRSSGSTPTGSTATSPPSATGSTPSTCRTRPRRSSPTRSWWTPAPSTTS